MFRKKRIKTIRSSFRAFFSYQAMDALVKKLYVVIPDISSMTQRTNTQLTIYTDAFLMHLFKKYPSLDKKISMVNLDLLQETLAIHLRKRTDRLVKLNPDDIKFEKFDLDAILKRQGEMLRELVEEQKKVLKHESQSIGEQELERFRKRYEARSKRRNSRNI